LLTWGVLPDWLLAQGLALYQTRRALAELETKI
jgi:hypothetical protein